MAFKAKKTKIIKIGQVIGKVTNKKMGKKMSKKDEEREKGSLLVGSNTGENTTLIPVKNSTLFKPGNSEMLCKRYTDPEILEAAMSAYFDKCDSDKKPYTTVGLALALGFNSRSSLLNYERETGYEEFFDIMRRAKLRIEEQMEIHLMTKQNVAGVIFLAKNNYSYKDSTEVDLKSKNEFLTQLLPTPATGKEITSEN
jgi:hypothetical protein